MAENPELQQWKREIQLRQAEDDREFEESKKRVQLRQGQQLLRAYRWLALVMLLVVWYLWFDLIHRRWGEANFHPPGIVLLIFLPMPCVWMFLKEDSQNPLRRPISPIAAWLTYTLMLFAWQVAATIHH